MRKSLDIAGILHVAGSFTPLLFENYLQFNALSKFLSAAIYPAFTNEESPIVPLIKVQWHGFPNFKISDKAFEFKAGLVYVFVAAYF